MTAAAKRPCVIGQGAAYVAISRTETTTHGSWVHWCAGLDQGFSERNASRSSIVASQNQIWQLVCDTIGTKIPEFSGPTRGGSTGMRPDRRWTAIGYSRGFKKIDLVFKKSKGRAKKISSKEVRPK
jgi:hypothetical protein